MQKIVFFEAVILKQKWKRGLSNLGFSYSFGTFKNFVGTFKNFSTTNFLELSASILLKIVTKLLSVISILAETGHISLNVALKVSFRDKES